MGGFFRTDGKFFTAMGRLVDLFFVCLLWIAGCIPVVTFITSSASMYHTVVKCIRYDRGDLFPEFRQAYKNNLRQGIPLTLIYGGAGALIGLSDYRVFFRSTERSWAFFVLAVGLLVLSLVYLVNLLWIAPVFSRFSNTLGNILKLNYVIAFRNIPRSVPMLFVVIAAAILILALNELVFILPSVVMLIHSLLTEPAMRRYMPRQDEDNGDWRYGYR